MTSHEALRAGVALLPELKASLETLRMIQGSGTYIENAEAKVKLDEQEPKLHTIIAALEAAQPMLSGGDGMVDDEWKFLEEACDFASKALSNAEKWRQEHPGKNPPSEMLYPVRHFEDACGPLMIKRLIKLARSAPAPASNGEAMVERVARAISPEWFTDDGLPPLLNNYPDQHFRYQEIAREKARAALAAINEKAGE